MRIKISRSYSLKFSCKVFCIDNKLSKPACNAGTNDISNNTNYLENVKKIVKLVKENCKDTKLSFPSVICRTDVKDIVDTINTTNSQLQNYCKQQNVGFIDNGNIKKSDLNPKGLHLHERGSKKSVRFYKLNL